MSRFSEFWEAWPAGPRKVNRKGCEQKWQAKKLDSEADAILAHVRWNLRNNPQWKQDQKGQNFIPMPVTYLNQERWNDGTFENGKLFDKSPQTFDVIDVNRVCDWIKDNRTLTPAELRGPWTWVQKGGVFVEVRIGTGEAIQIDRMV